MSLTSTPSVADRTAAVAAALRATRTEPDPVVLLQDEVRRLRERVERLEARVDRVGLDRPSTNGGVKKRESPAYEVLLGGR